jgi:hypothetical protein
MPAIDFPNSPSVNQTFTVGERTWKWTGTTWDVVVTTQVTGATGATGPAGADGVGIPAGGSTTQILAKSSGTNYATEWVDKPKVSYTHTQNAVSYNWVITHSLGYYPNVVVTDSAGTVIEGDIAFNSINQITITLSQALSGYAHIS